VVCAISSRARRYQAPFLGLGHEVPAIKDLDYKTPTRKMA
jgi:hypothetical protein